MGRFTTAVAVMALAVSACSSGSATSTSTPTAAASMAVAATAPTMTPATPTATPLPIATPVPLAVTVVFDGKACTWKGVRDVPRGTELTINMVNTPAATKATGGAAFVFMHVMDGVTWDQVLAGRGNHDANYVPKWADQAEMIMQTPDNIAAGDTSMTHQLLSNEYLTICATKTGPSTVDTFPAALLYIYDR